MRDERDARETARRDYTIHCRGWSRPEQVSDAYVDAYDDEYDRIEAEAETTEEMWAWVIGDVVVDVDQDLPESPQQVLLRWSACERPPTIGSAVPDHVTVVRP